MTRRTDTDQRREAFDEAVEALKQANRLCLDHSLSFNKALHHAVGNIEPITLPGIQKEAMTRKLDENEILQLVGAIYEATLDVDEGDEQEALLYIHELAAMILDGDASRRTTADAEVDAIFAEIEDEEEEIDERVIAAFDKLENPSGTGPSDTPRSS
jgi:hypothetical protein